MNSRTDALFLEAIQLPAGSERDAFLDDACRDDTDLRRRIEAMLADDSAADAFFDGPDTVATPSAGSPSHGEKPGDVIGRFRLLQIIGEGGFGTVWMAEQSDPVQRRVALKIIRIGMDTREFIARFEQERQALAMMDHPNIARVLDGGATPGGRPYFVMELVKGVPITKFCDEQKLPLAARLALFVEVCHAINHAHQKGVIHRDIKPSNVMVTLDGDKPVPKVIDFGIAKATQGKLTDQTVITRFEQFIGTPVYMSPEQAGLGGLDIDTRADIYGLGMLLYELLTGKPPFDAKSLASAGYEEMRRIIREVEPPKPSSKLSTIIGDERTTLAEARHVEPGKLSRMVEPDLDWIVMKAIEKDRSRRYETVNGLALDIQRFLTNEPVSAGPPTARYRFRKFARRNKSALRVAAGIVTLLVAATIVSSWQALRATTAEKLATDRLEEKEQALKDAEAISTFLADVFQSPDPSRDGLSITVAETLDSAAKKLDNDLAGQPGHHAKLQDALGRAYDALGLPRKAIPLLEKARDYYRAAVGREHPYTLAAMHTLALSYDHAGRQDEAIKLKEEVLTLRRKVSDPTNPATLKAMNNLAISYADAGLLDEAIELQKEVLTLRIKLLGKEDPDTLGAMSNLASTYHEAGRMDEALRLRDEVLPLSKQVNGPEHPDTLGAMTNLAVSYGAAGHIVEAITLQEQSLAIKRRVLPPNHPYITAALRNLADLYEKDGRKEEAQALRKELAGRRNPHPPSPAPAPEPKTTPEPKPRPEMPAVSGTLVPPNSVWKWLHPTDGIDPAEKVQGFHTAFFRPDFNDSAWNTGRDSDEPDAGFGYGLNFKGVSIGKPGDVNQRHTAYFRHRFTADKEYTNLELRCQFDDGIIVYLDGVRVVRDNVNPGAEAWLLPSAVPMERENDSVIHRNAISGTLAPGTHVLAISVHNTAQRSSDLRLGGVSLVELKAEAK